MKRKKNVSYISFGSKDWANETLSYAIQVLKGRKIVSRLKGRIFLALYLRDMLLDYGFWWQAKVLEIWIRRAQKGEFIASERSERAYEPSEARRGSYE